MATTLLVVAVARAHHFSIASGVAFAVVIGLGLAMIVWRRNRWERSDAARANRRREDRTDVELRHRSDRGSRMHDAAADEPTEPGTR
jgi:Flp pilus assembly protein TadB